MKFAVAWAACCEFAAAYKATWVWSEKFAKPDGVDHLVYAVNGVFPPPAVRVLPGEEVEITVVNKLSSQSMAIHWHGQHHDGTPWQDGAAMFSQCPIPAGSEWTYKFKANPQPGTYLYHGHVGGTAARVFGSFIIEGDVSSHAAAAIGEHTFMLGDWWHMSEQHMSAGVMALPFRWPGDPQSILVNGKGNFPCDANEVYTCGTDNCTAGSTVVAGAGTSPWFRYSSHGSLCDSSAITPLERFEGSQGKTYLLRFIAGSLLSLFNVAIESHSMTVVEVDGYPTEPYSTSSVDINSGQRVGVLVTLDKTPGDYVISFKTRTRKAVRTANALLHYLESAAPLMSRSQADAVTVAHPDWNNHSFTRDFQNSIQGLYSGNTALSPVPPDSEVERRFVFLTTHEYVEEDEYSNTKHSITSIDDAVGSGENRPEKFCSSDKFSGNHKNVWMLGRTHFKKSKTPVLGMLHYGIDVDELREERGHYEVEIGKTYDIVVNHYPNCFKSCDTHSWHLHSGHFWSLGTFSGKWTGSDAQLAALNVANPPMRDSVSTASEGDENHKLDASDPFQPCGYTVLRFRVEHAGLYLFHCHHLFHEMMGQMALFYTNGSTIPPPPDNVLTCSKMTSSVVSPATPQVVATTTTTTVAGPKPAVPSEAVAGANNIVISLDPAVASPGAQPAATKGSDTEKAFQMTQDGGWVALLVLSIILVLINGKSFLMLSRVEGLTHQISSAGTKPAQV